MGCAIEAAVLAVLACGTLTSQPADHELQFEVAAVKPSPPSTQPSRGRRGCFGGPGSRNPGVYTCTKATLAIMISTPYDLQGYQIRPAAGKFTDEFEVIAKVPPGASGEQVQTMLRNLLTEHFKLEFHRETGQIPGFALVVAKGGLRMKEWVPVTPVEGANGRPPAKSGGLTNDAEGFVYRPVPNGISVARSGGLTRWVGSNCSIEILAGYLNTLLDRPAFDATGLKRNYDFVLTFSSDNGGALNPAMTASDEWPADSGLTIFGALEKQLGLRLEKREKSVELFVVDRFEKKPLL
jgi:uncharacterized protein (TIGR03435 family)